MIVGGTKTTLWRHQRGVSWLWPSKSGFHCLPVPFTTLVIMSALCCCCPCFTGSSAEERLPISRPNTTQRRDPGDNIYENVPADDPSFPATGPTSSKRTTHGAVDPTGLQKGQKVTMKLVNMPDVDMLFSDIAETFNEQQDNHSAMEDAMKEFKQACGCAANCSLTTCVEKVKLEYGDRDVKLQMKGYNFSLRVEDGDVPHHLEQAGAQVGNLSRATKMILAKETKLQEMIRSVQQSRDQLAESLKDTQPAHLDLLRFQKNLEDNLRNVGLVQQKSKQYLEEAKSVLTEVAELAGAKL